MYSVKEVKDMLEVSEKTIRYYIKNKYLVASKIGRA